LAIPRGAWEELAGFPEPFFMYCEDVDLSLRLRLMGGRLGVIPRARIVHGYEFMRDVDKWRLLERNRWATVVRTYPTALLALVLPALLAAEIAVWGLALRGGWAREKARATFELIRWLPRLRRERRAIQAQRTVSASTFALGLTAELSSPYLGRLADSVVIRKVLARYWELVRLLLARAAA
jgi:GT2 family glycosyltransferase